MIELPSTSAQSSAQGGVAGLWRSLWDSGQSRISYLARALLADVPLTLAIVLFVGWLTQTPWPRFEGYPLARVLVAMCLFAPIGETLLMAVLFWLLKFFIKRDGMLVVVSAVIWAALHSTANRLWGPQIFWAFVIFSLCYVTWSKRSVWQAIAMTATLHMLHNAVPAIFLIATRLSATP